MMSSIARAQAASRNPTFSDDEDPRLRGVDRLNKNNRRLMIDIAHDNRTDALENAIKGDALRVRTHLRRARNASLAPSLLYSSEIRWHCLRNANRANQKTMVDEWVELAEQWGKWCEPVSPDILKQVYQPATRGGTAREALSEAGDASNAAVSGSRLVALPAELQALIFAQVSPRDYLAGANACRALYDVLSSPAVAAEYGRSRFPFLQGGWFERFGWFKLVTLAKPPPPRRVGPHVYPSYYDKFVDDFRKVQLGEVDVLRLTQEQGDNYNHVIGAVHRFLRESPKRLAACATIRELEISGDSGLFVNNDNDVLIADIVRLCANVSKVEPVWSFDTSRVVQALFRCKKLESKDWLLANRHSKTVTIDDVVMAHRHWPEMKRITIAVDRHTTAKKVLAIIKASPKLERLHLKSLRGDQFSDECLNVLPASCETLALDADSASEGEKIAISDQCIIETLRRLPQLKIALVGFKNLSIAIQDNKIASRFTTSPPSNGNVT